MTTTLDRPSAEGGSDPSGGAHAGEHRLRANTLGVLDSVVMGVAGVAPAYSIAASTAVLVAAVGLAGPSSLLWCGIAMFGIVWAFAHLGRTEVNAGASYAWVRRALHPVLGYLAGWCLVVSALLFMVAGSLPAGSVTIGLFSASAANNITLVTIVGSVFFAIMVVAVLVGVRITATAQMVMSSIELVLLLLFAVLAIVHGATAVNPAHRFSWSWLSPTDYARFGGGSGGFVAGALVAAFYYWGWDVTANLNEETRNARTTPGVGAMLGLVVVLALFLVFTIGTNLVLSAHSVQVNSADVLDVLGQAVWHGWGGKLIVVAVILSTVATLETTLIQVTRSLFAMGRDHTMPRIFSMVHPSWRTPWIATIIVGVVSIGLFVASNFVGSVGTVLTDAIDAIGLQITIYYGLAGLAAVVLFRRHLFSSVKNFFFMGLWPLAGSIFMFVVLAESIGPNGGKVDEIGVGAIALGIIPLVIYWVKGSPFFKMPARSERVVGDTTELDLERS